MIAGVSVNSEARPALQGELGVLKTSAVTTGIFKPDENKAIRPDEVHRAKAALKGNTVLVSRMNTASLVAASVFVPEDYPSLMLPDRIWMLEPHATVDARWLHTFLSSPAIRAKLSAMATGTSGSMKNLSKERFLSLEVLVPPLHRQREIAEILSSLDDLISASIAVIDQLRLLRSANLQALTSGAPIPGTEFNRTPFGFVPASWNLVPFGGVVERVRAPVKVDPHQKYREIGVRSHGRGVFHKEEVKGSDLGSKRVFWVQPGCLVFNIVFAWEGAVASTSDAEVRMIASHRFPMFRPREGIADVAFLRSLFQTRRGIALLGMFSPGGAGRNKTLNQSSLRALDVPLPPLADQRKLTAAVNGIEEHLHMENDHLEALHQLRIALSDALLTGKLDSPHADRAA